MVSSAWDLGQNTRAEPGLVSLTLHHHTSTDNQLLHLCHAVKGDVVTRDQAPPLVLKIDLVFQPSIFCKETQNKNKLHQKCVSKLLIFAVVLKPSAKD